MSDTNHDARLVLVTAPDVDTAQRLARLLLEQKLAACVNVVSQLTSFFWWQGKIDRQDEALLLIKTTAAKVPALIDSVQKEHPYEVPEVIMLPIVSGAEKYLKWLHDSIA